MPPHDGDAGVNAPETPIERRKDEHIHISLNENVEAAGVTAGFERLRLKHNALPEVDLDDIDLETPFLGRTLPTPLMISSMIGGTPRSHEILVRMATAAEQTGFALGLGSQRAALEKPDLEAYFQVREAAPTAYLMANIGAIQLNYGVTAEECEHLVRMVCADALILHLNPVQEAVQTEGDRNFAGLLERVERVVASLSVPVIVKEVGFGISDDVAARLKSAGVRAIDVAGAGGTSWSAVESHRPNSSLHRHLGRKFRDWGIPTVDCIRMIRAFDGQIPLIASGGVHDGINAAKAIALGANLAGIATPVLRATAQGEDEAVTWLTQTREELRLSMFATGSRSVQELSTAPLLDAFVF